MPVGSAKFGLFAAAGAGGGSAGYFGGGRQSAASYASTIESFDFSDDSRSVSSTVLSSPRRALAGMSNAGVAGYFSGGKTQTSAYGSAVVEKFAFADSSISTLSTGLSYTGDLPRGMSNSGTAGYTTGGYAYSGGWINYDTVDKFAFSNDARSTLSTGLSMARYGGYGMSNSGTAGYYAGGREVGGAGNVTTVDKFAFSNDSRSTLSASLPAGRYYGASMSNSGTAGYCAGGHDGNTLSAIEKYTFSTDTRATLSAGLSAAAYGTAGISNSGAAGYVGGGAGFLTTVDKLAFSNDSRTTLSEGLTTGTYSLAGIQNEESLA
ncbi:MAG: hypothetical protein HOD33_03700 [Acidiferrobacteraceae bacterium]|nr:hypothetical protein [Acidiferrobacteraceae bacterium]